MIPTQFDLFEDDLPFEDSIIDEVEYEDDGEYDSFLDLAAFDLNELEDSNEDL